MIVSVAQGLLEGRQDKSLTTGRTFSSFLNIPYAEPPVGELRFRPPVPPAKWQGVRNAKREGKRCFQLLKKHQANESEDCLYLNVFTPGPPNTEAPLKPVVVYLHGGGHYFGDGSTEAASPDSLINYDVIIVTVNYRLHIFGFFNMNAPSSVGNCGSKDHVQALRWVQENIKSFGGDPDNVTVLGDCSGASAAHLLTVSPLAEGLFQKVIASSGSIISPWTPNNQVQEGFEIGRRLGFTGTDPEEPVAFLKTRTALSLAAEAKRMIFRRRKRPPYAMRSVLTFVPSIEKYEQDAFLPDHPHKLILKSKPVLFLAGVSEQERLWGLLGFYDYERLLVNLLKNSLVDLVELYVPCHRVNLFELVEEVREHYFARGVHELSADEEFEKLIEIYSHLYLVALDTQIDYTIKRSSAPAYRFTFSFVGQLNEYPHFHMPISSLHTDHSEYVTLSRCLHPSGIRLDEESRKVMECICTAYANFARNSDPNPLPQEDTRWEPYTTENPTYLKFDTKCIPVQDGDWSECLNLWYRMLGTYANPE